MKNLAVLAALVLTGVGLVAAGCGGGQQAPASSAPAATAAAAPDARLATAWRVERAGWIFVHLEGPPSTLGYQHGVLLAKEIEDLLRVTAPWLEKTTRRDWAFYRDAAEKILWPKVDAEFQAELDGIVAGLNAKGVKADRWDIVALNGLEELPGYYVPWLDKQQGRPPAGNSGAHCSAFVATGSWTKDRRIVIGHNAWTNYITGARWNIMFDLVPEKGHRILMDGLPGIITSDDDFGINAAGLMVTETTITQFFGFDPNGTPEFYRSRKALQYATSIDEYVKIMLDGNNGGYANDWLLGDNKTGEIARFELGLKNHSVERTKDGYFVGANFPVHPKLIKEETTFDTSKKDNPYYARRTRWEQLMARHKGQIDVELGKAFESDAYDVILKKEGPTERTLCGLVDTSPRGLPEWEWAPFYPGGTVQAKVTDSKTAEAMQMWAAMGHPCAPDFVAEDYLKQRPEWAWTRGLLTDMKTQPWASFTAGVR